MPAAPLPNFTWPETPFSDEVPLGGPDGLLAFLQAEVEAWAWHVGNNPQLSTGVTSSIRSRDTSVERIIARIGDVKGDWTDHDREQVETLVGKVAAAGLPHRHSRFGRTVHWLAESSPQMASWVVAFVQQPAQVDAAIPNAGNAGRRYAASSGALAILMDLDLLRPSSSSADETRDEQVETLSSAVTAVHGQANAARERLNELEQRAKAREEDWSKEQELAKDAFSSLMADSKEELGALKELYDNELSLRSPVQYWKEKAEEHAKAWKLYLGACVLLLVIVGAVGYIVSERLGLLPSSMLAPDPPTPADPMSRLPNVALLLLAVGLLVWPLRLAVRLFQREGQLRDDAKHRETLAMTYLSLLRDESGHDSPEQRLLVLTHLFAPVGSEASDDGMPNGQLAMLTTLLAGRNKGSG